nr:hypothetical protein L203_05933 [Cryptococcus depauperatus CBS 7841]
MPVDADAYMAGAIPSLSLGVHRPASLPPSQVQGGSAYGSLPRSACIPQTPPPLGHSPFGNGNLWIKTPLRSPSMGSSTGSDWTSPWSFEDDYFSGARSKASRRSRTHSIESHGRKQSSLSHYHFDDHLPAEMGRSWEMHSGSPKVVNVEPDYGLKTNIYAKVDGRLKKVSDASAPSPYKKLPNHLVLPPSTRDNEFLKPRPVIERRHTHVPAVLSKKKLAQENHLSRSAQLNCQLARLSLQDQDGGTPTPKPSQSLEGYPESQGKHPAPKRPSIEKKHSSSQVSPSSQAPSSLPLSPPVNKALYNLKRQRQLSNPPNPPSPSYLREDAAFAGPTLHLSTPRSAHGSSFSHSESVTTSVIKQFPRLNTGRGPYKPSSPPISSGPTTASIGYVSPLEDDTYNRYSSHPASPLPQYVEKHVVSTPPISPSASLEPMRPPQPRPPTDGNYIPPGYPKPTKDLPTNRDGPVMKTYGIGWDKKGDPERLPLAPEGPRWTIARPPNVDQVVGGSWWSAGRDEGSG